ncbi:AraC family transcriptional regulator [Burkholderiaceae bacterium DAT-1]|nr:AraC family transcriptional regulator [Burkholderiaceae bacterium DAT-1]
METDQRRHATIVPTIARALLAQIEAQGTSPDQLCRGLGFSYPDLLHHHLHLSYAQVRELIVRSQRLIQDPVLGLMVGIRQMPVSWGVAGLMMLTCETLGEAMLKGISHQDDAGTLVNHIVHEMGAEMHIEVVPRHMDQLIETFLIDEALASVVSVGRYLAGAAFSPLRVDFALPRPGQETAFSQILGCPVRFDTGSNRIILATHWLETRLPGYDRVTSGAVQSQLSTLLAKPAGRYDLVETVANRVRTEQGALPKQVDIASMVNVSPRTLRRRLGEQDTSYRSLRDSARYAKACELLLNSDATIAEVAERVGYSDARAFRRAFKRWSGVLPTDFREREAG